MDPVVFYHELEVAAKVTATVLCTLFAAYFWNRRRNTELKSTRMVFLGQGLFVLCFGLTRSLFIVADYFSPELPEAVVLFVDPNLFFLLWKVAALVGILAIIFLLIVIETYLVKSRYIFSLIASAGLIIALASQDITISRWTTYITLPVAMIGAIALYFHLFFKTKGIIRTKVGMSIVGLLFLGGGTLLDTASGKATLESIFGFFPGLIPIILLTAGLAIYTYYNVKEL